MGFIEIINRRMRDGKATVQYFLGGNRDRRSRLDIIIVVVSIYLMWWI